MQNFYKILGGERYLGALEALKALVISTIHYSLLTTRYLKYFFKYFAV